MPRISIIIPIYNVAPYLSRCIESILKQTYTDWELLLIDDGSQDDSAEVCRRYAVRDVRIRFFEQKNAGVSAARNRGLREACGDYVTFVDGDDWIEAPMLQEMISRTLDDTYEIVVGGYIDDTEGHCTLAFDNATEQPIDSAAMKKEFFTHNLFMWTACDKIFLRKILPENGFDEHLAIAEDQQFLWDVLRRVKRAYYVPLYQHHYCHRVNSAMMSRFTEKTCIRCVCRKRFCKRLKGRNLLRLHSVLIWDHASVLSGRFFMIEQRRHTRAN